MPCREHKMFPIPDSLSSKWLSCFLQRFGLGVRQRVSLFKNAPQHTCHESSPSGEQLNAESCLCFSPIERERYTLNIYPRSPSPWANLFQLSIQIKIHALTKQRLRPWHKPATGSVWFQLTFAISWWDASNGPHNEHSFPSWKVL